MLLKHTLVSLLPILALASVAFSQTPVVNLDKVDWSKQNAETLRHYRALVQIDTSSPPGNETKAVEYLKKVLEAEGIPTQVFAKDPARANLVARLKGNGSKRPVLIMAHTDVVGVQREKWPVDPFGAVMKDGYVWGRGTADDKDILAANLMTMLVLKRSGMKLDRDVIFVAESGEEADPLGVGINYLVEQHFDAINAEFALTEGGSGTINKNNKVTAIAIETTEKTPRRVRLVVNGTAGHGSVPRLDNALTHLSIAVGKVGTWETPMRLNDTTRTYFEKLSTISSPENAAHYKDLLDPKRSAAAQRYLAANEPEHYSMLRTSVVPTILKAGFRMNVIPSEAEATLDIRALPDEDIPKFFEEMTRVIGDAAVKIEPTGNTRPISPPSKLDSEMYRALENVSKRMYPGVTVLPTMLTGSTDMSQLRAKGVQSYGIGPATTPEDGMIYGAHSDVERLPETSLYKFTEFTFNAVAEVSVHK